jgi:hypothetical protein
MTELNIERYRPIFIQTAIQYFFDRVTFQIYSGNVVIDLMDYFPMFKQGYALSETIFNLSTAYNMIHNLWSSPDQKETIIPDNLYIEAYGSNIPAFNFEYDDVNGSSHYVPMQDAVNQGLIPNNLSTFEAIQSYDPELNPQHINHYIFGLITHLNSQDPSQVPELSTLVKNEHGAAALYNEYVLAGEIYVTLGTIVDYRGPGSKITVSDVIIVAVRYKYELLLNRLLADKRVNKLIYAIIIGDINLVDKYLNLYDPRDNNLEAYHLAVEENKPIIAERIRKAIEQRTILERRAFQTMEPLGKLDVPESQMFYEYSRYLANK